MEGLIFGLCALLASLSAAICLHIARQRRHKTDYRLGRRAHVTASVACVAATLLAIPAFADAVDRLTAYNEISKLGSDLGSVVFLAGLQIMLVDWRHTKAHVAGVAVRMAVVVVVALSLVWEYHCADTGHVELTTAYAASGAVRAYLLTYLVFSILAGLEISGFSTTLARRCWRRRRAAATGLAIAAAGGVFGVLFGVSRASYLVAYGIGHAWPWSLEHAISPALAGLSIICVAVGLTLATVGYGMGSRSAARTT